MTGSWYDDAACVHSDADLFFPDGHTHIQRILAAKEVCASCPVQPVCLDWALDAREPHGMWGGLTEDERKSLLRKRTPSRRQAIATKALAPQKSWPGVQRVLIQYGRVTELRGKGWGRRRIASALGIGADSLETAERMVQQAGSVGAALDLVVAA